MENASTCKQVPTQEQMQGWAEAALSKLDKPLELSVRIVDESESGELNERFRHKQGSTNVLSFPADLPEELDLPLLGDLVICAPVVEREATEQSKPPEAHWAHMIVHGCLHLIGYDHLDDTEAEVMETLETNILVGLGFPPPYQETLCKSN
ncbi:MAG: rRNA maturation RNase YbeY [Gammaproteobacteria bacterium]|nr:MAG: rRNA maturation RNase YbeY [Gammaproteobacteria bacterium]